MNQDEITSLAKALAIELARELRGDADHVVHSMLRDVASREHVQQVGSLTIDVARCVASVDGKPIALKPREFALLAILAAHPGHAFSRDRLLELAWKDRGEDVGSDRTVDVHVARLRGRLGSAASLLATVHGVGYKLGT